MKCSPDFLANGARTQPESYDRWFQAKVSAALNSRQPRTPHDEVMASAQQLIEQAKTRRKEA